MSAAYWADYETNTHEQDQDLRVPRPGGRRGEREEGEQEDEGQSPLCRRRLQHRWGAHIKR